MAPAVPLGAQLRRLHDTPVNLPRAPLTAWSTIERWLHQFAGMALQGVSAAGRRWLGAMPPVVSQEVRGGAGCGLVASPCC